MKRWEVAFRLVGLGWYIGACIFLGVSGGIWLDKKLNTKPVLVIIGLLLGIIVACKSSKHIPCDPPSTDKI